MTSTRRIKGEVARLLETPGADARPLPIERLVRALGVELTLEPLDSDEDLSGFYFRQQDRRVIGVNSRHPRVRQRFTIAHEIGHFILHDQEGLHLDEAFRFRDARSSQAVDPEEIAANRFAAELLMPEAEVLDFVSHEELDLNDDDEVRRIARHFGVSQQALLYRLANLGVRYAGVVEV